MSSADFSQFVVTTANGTACETSTLKVRALSPHLPATLTGTSSNLLDFTAFSRLIRISQPYMWFLFVRPRVCLQLPSDSTSRWTPLLFSYTFPTTRVCSGLSPVRARPWRANKKNPSGTPERKCSIMHQNPHDTPYHHHEYPHSEDPAGCPALPYSPGKIRCHFS